MCWNTGGLLLTLCMLTVHHWTKITYQSAAMCFSYATLTKVEANLSNLEAELFSIFMVCLLSPWRIGTLHGHFLPNIIVIFCQFPLLSIPTTTAAALVKDNIGFGELTRQRSSEALDFRPMNESELPSTLSHVSKDTYFWNRPTPEELVLSYNQLKQLQDAQGSFGEPEDAFELQNYSNLNKTRGKRRKKYNYRPHLWTPLKTENCYNFEPPDVLTPKEIDQYEQSLYAARNPYSHPPRVIRENAIARSSEQQQLNARVLQWYQHMPHPFNMWKRRTMWRKRRTQSTVPRTGNGNSQFTGHVYQNDKTNKQEKEQRGKSKERIRRSYGIRTKLPMEKHQDSKSSDHSHTVITVHRILIRPSVIALQNGGLHARLRYIIQLHRKLTGFYRLKIEARIDPDYPPIYVGSIQNVCAHWPANLPRTSCSMNKSRFYQKGQICFCHMPPGIYRQRLRLNLTNILDGLEVPRFLVNFLFNGKKMNIHLSLKLEDENDQLVGCLSLTLPLLLKSA